MNKLIGTSPLGLAMIKYTNEIIARKGLSKNIEVRDLKPSKDAKGGYHQTTSGLPDYRGERRP